MDTTGCAAPARDDCVAAHAVRCETVMAETGRGAGCLSAQTNAVCGGGNVADSVNAVRYRGYKLVHADDQNYFVGSVDQRCNPVAVAVYIDQLALRRDGVCTHKIDIAAEGIPICLFDFFRRFGLASVDQADVVPAFEHIHDTAVFQ